MKNVQALIKSYYQFNSLNTAQELKAKTVCAVGCAAACGVLCISNKVDKKKS